MPRDQRLYMTFPNDFLDHPKFALLSDNAIVTFVGMNGYSRVHNLDGRIPADVAKKRWRAAALKELQNNHPERPSLKLVGDAYEIHNYAEHQLTSADIEDLREKRSQAGAKGGRAAAIARASAIAKPKQTGSKRVAEKESESKSEQESDFSDVNESSQVSNARAAELDSIALGIGITNLTKTRTQLEKATGEPVTDRGAIELVTAITSRAAGHIRNIDAYIATACRKSPHEVQAAYFDLDIGGIP